MSDKPLVSIITPSYNQGEYLEETIQSVLNQTYENIEYIIIDGASTDNSIDIIKKYERQLTYWVSETDQGQADAINKGFLKARGKYLCWINSDDVIYKNFISSRINEFRNNSDISMIYGDVHQGINSGNKKIRKGRYTDFNTMLETLSVPIPQQSSIWKRDIIKKIGLLDENWHVLLDREYFMRIARYYNIKYISGSVAFFRNHESSKSINEEYIWADEIPLLYNKILKGNIYLLKEEYLEKNRDKILPKAYLYAAGIYRKYNKNQQAINLEKKAYEINKLLTIFFILNKRLLIMAIEIKKLLQFR